MADTAIYVYCVAELASPRSKGTVPEGLPGGSRPELVDVGRGLWAVAAEVPLARYGPERIEAGLQQMSWVADIAVAHEAVVEYYAARRGATVLPMKLFTLYLSRERARRDLGAARKALRVALQRVRGCQEWGVRAIRSTSRRPVSPARAATSASAGVAFLEAKKRARDDVREATIEAAAAAESAYELLTPLSKDVRRRTDVPTSATTPPLLDAAFLVKAERKTRFRAAARRAAAACREAGVELTLTGPWPVYNFVQRPEPTA